jgi:hypothetical protein
LADDQIPTLFDQVPPESLAFSLLQVMDFFGSPWLPNSSGHGRGVKVNFRPA